MSDKYEAVIGLEVHAQLLTTSKLFCGCRLGFGAGVNAQTCEVCLGMPGSLPTVNAQAVELATRATLALGLTVNRRSQWSRKNYFYPDLPKGYQITQDTQPIGLGGKLAFELDGQELSVRITRIHIEEDAGKNVHDDMLAGARSYVDFNRGGTALIEIVSEPDLRSSHAAAAYLKELRQCLRFLQVCDGNMDEGSLRCDANVSVRLRGTEKLGTRVELKNINSFRFVQQAIDYEIARQIDVIESGGSVAQQTRLWDTQAKESRAMRSKAEAHDYRYFPEPDLPDLLLSEAFVQNVKDNLAELPAAKRARFVSQFGLSAYDARVLTDEHEVARFFEDGVAAAPNNAKAVANWVINEVLRERDVRALKIDGGAIGELVQLIDDGTISGKMAKELLVELLANGGSPAQIVKSRGLSQENDPAALLAFVQEAIAEHAEVVERFHAGKRNGMGFLVGLVLKKSGGSANPKLVTQMVLENLEKLAPKA